MATPTPPRIYLVNEQHELSPLKKGGGGGNAKLRVDWPTKGVALRQSLRDALAQEAVESPDPSVGPHHFLLARPELNLEYEGKDGGVPVVKPKQVLLQGRDSRVFRRLGIDLVGSVDGAAIVHLTEATRARFENELEALDEVGKRRRDDLSLLSEFAPIPLSARLDERWLERESPGPRADVVLELMPFLAGSEVDAVIAAIRRDLLRIDPKAQWHRIGRDVSRRAWMRVDVERAVLPELLTRFPAIRRAHPPLYFVPDARATRAVPASTSVAAAPQWLVSRVPLVGIVDLGIPEQHGLLGVHVAHRYRHPSGGLGARGDHGSKVASRVVFPVQDDGAQGIPSGPTCRVVDINACDPDEDLLDAKAIAPMMLTAHNANPDLRVFNLSCSMDGPSLSVLMEVETQAYAVALEAMAGLDNLAFENDLLIVCAAGNVPLGAVPSEPYPDHWRDSTWHLRAPAAGANLVTVGSTVGQHISFETVVGEPDRPSPFARVGLSPLPGIKPDFTAVGGKTACSRRGSACPCSIGSVSG